MSDIERIGISLDKNLLSMFDELIGQRGYPNRSEAIRDMIRDQLSKDTLAQPDAQAVAGLFMVYDHHSSTLTQKLTDLQHNHLLHVIVSTHVHLDHHNCLEVIIMKGKVGEIEKLANNITALKGVKLSRVNIMAKSDIVE